ncbi:MAG: hypothetical protein ACTHKS_09705 [Gaiellaceae bacterium]
MRASFALLCVLAIPSVAAATSTGASRPNVTGKFVRSASISGCYQGEPCDPPPPAAFLVFTRNGHSTRARIGVKGAFAVRLASGRYKVTLIPSQRTGVLPASIRVPRTGVIHPRFVQQAS